tara:strand:- start:376 stop:573 length:198 start_codon:yes stop_codon:yes gene_type:complete
MSGDQHSLKMRCDMLAEESERFLDEADTSILTVTRDVSHVIGRLHRKASEVLEDYRGMDEELMFF